MAKIIEGSTQVALIVSHEQAKYLRSILGVLPSSSELDNAPAQDLWNALYDYSPSSDIKEYFSYESEHFYTKGLKRKPWPKP